MNQFHGFFFKCIFCESKLLILWNMFKAWVQGTESNTHDIEYLISSSFRMDVAKKNY